MADGEAEKDTAVEAGASAIDGNRTVMMDFSEQPRAQKGPAKDTEALKRKVLTLCLLFHSISEAKWSSCVPCAHFHALAYTITTIN